MLLFVEDIEKGDDIMTVDYYIREDIEKCEQVLKSDDIIQINDLLVEFQMKYKVYWGDLYILGPNSLVNDKNTSINELKGLKGRLNTLACYSNTQLLDLMMSQKGISIEKNLHSKVNNQVIINIDVLFEQVIKDIEENGFLGDESKKEIVEKVNELKAISNSNDSKSKKWAKIKPILNWITTKGSDIFLKIMPLIIQSLNNTK